MSRKQRIFPDTVLSAFHDDDVGWCVKAERRGEEPFLCAAYAEDAAGAHWLAGEVAKAYGCKVEPLRMN
jgi:hypothetical protein